MPVLGTRCVSKLVERHAEDESTFAADRQDAALGTGHVASTGRTKSMP